MAPLDDQTTADAPTTAGPAIGSALLVGLASGVVGTLVGWVLLWSGTRDLYDGIAATRGITIPVEVDTTQALAFGGFLTGISLLVLLVARGTAGSWGRVAAISAGSLALWTIAAWLLYGADQFWLAWAGPVDPLGFSVSGGVVRTVTVAAFAGPVCVMCVMVMGAWSGARWAPRPVNRQAEARDTSRRLASALVGTAVVLGLAGTWVLASTAWWPHDAWGVMSMLTTTPMVTTVVAVAVAWTVSGHGRGTTVLLFVAATALMARDLRTSGESLSAVGAVLLGITTVVVASARRPLADTLRRLTL